MADMRAPNSEAVMSLLHGGFTVGQRTRLSFFVSVFLPGVVLFLLTEIKLISKKA